MSSRFAAAAVAVLAVVLACAAEARAVFTTGVFDALDAEVVKRRDNDFPGKLTKQQKKQKAAVTSAAKAIEKAASDLRYDVKVAGSSSKSLAKAYPADFGGASDPNAFEPLFLDVFSALRTQLGDQYDALDGRRADFSGKTAKTFGGKLSSATKAITAHDGLAAADFKGRAKRLGQAASALFAAQKLAAKLPLRGLFGTVAGAPWRANNYAAATVYEGDDTLYVVGVLKNDADDKELIQLYVKGVTGQGDYPLNAGPSALLGNFHTEPAAGHGSQEIWSLVPGTGSLHVDVLDTAAKRANLSFHFTGHNTQGGDKEIDVTLEIAGSNVSSLPDKAFQ